MTANNNTETEIVSVGLEDEGFDGDDEGFETGLFFDTFVWMAIDEDGNMPDVDEPGWGQYLDGFIDGSGSAMRTRVWDVVDHRISLGDDQDAYHNWMNGLKDGVRAYLEEVR